MASPTVSKLAPAIPKSAVYARVNALADHRQHLTGAELLNRARATATLRKEVNAALEQMFNRSGDLI